MIYFFHSKRPPGLDGKEAPAMFFACSARLARSGAIRKNLVRAASFRVMSTNPPETFIERFLCSSALCLLRRMVLQHSCSLPSFLG